MVLFITLLLQLSGSDSPIGVATFTTAGDLCLSMPSPVTTGAKITLVETTEPRRRATVAVGQPMMSCDTLERAMIPGPYYRIERPTQADPTSIYVAFRNAIQRGVRVRSCTSYEGVHLTVWAGQPLKSRRLWHTYYYLGYDVEPSCEDADTRD